MPVNGTQIDINTKEVTISIHVDSIIDIVKHKKNCKLQIDLLATSIRLKFNTPNQDDIYREKADQAIEYSAANYPSDATTYPFVQAEANATGCSPQQAADSIISARQLWMIKMADIEEERRRGKVLIELAVYIADVDTAFNNAKSALQLL